MDTAILDTDSSPMCSTLSSPSSPQVIEGQYVIQERLIKLLKDIYGTSEGKNNFRVEVCTPNLVTVTANSSSQLRLNRYKIYPAEHIPKVAVLTQVRNTS